MSASKYILNPNFIHKVLEEKGEICQTCGDNTNTAIKLVVPLEFGGKQELNNVIVLCRRCSIISDLGKNLKMNDTTISINFWVSHQLYKDIENLIGKNYQKSMGALVRYLISNYLTHPSMYQDMERYQSSGSDIKVNVKVDVDVYADFKICMEERGITITDAIKALICIYKDEVSTT